MRILWVAQASYVGGGTLALAEAVQALSQRGHEVHVVLPREGGLRDRLESARGISVVPHNPWAWPPSAEPRLRALRTRLRWLVFNIARAAPRIRRLAKVLDVEAVVTNSITIPAAAFAARAGGIPHVWFLQEFGDLDHGLRFHLGKTATVWWVNRLSAIVMVNSEAVRDHFASRIPSRKLRVVRYAILGPGGEARSAPGDPYRAVLLGMRSPGKGQEDAIRAVSILHGRGIDVQLSLVGGVDPSYDTELRRLAADLDVERRVAFQPFRLNGYESFACADVALMCSRSEALGRVTIEAMKMGKPVIGAAGGATPELIRPGENGFLYSPGDAEDLADRIEELRRDPLRAREMGERARQWANHNFNLESYGLALEQALEAATLSHRGAPVASPLGVMPTPTTEVPQRQPPLPRS